MSINSEMDICGPGGSCCLLFINNKTEIVYYFIKITYLKNNNFVCRILIFHNMIFYVIKLNLVITLQSAFTAAKMSIH